MIQELKVAAVEAVVLYAGVRIARTALNLAAQATKK